MTQQSPKPSQPNPQLTEADKLITAALAGGAEAHSYFRELMQLLLSLTVLAPGQSVRLHYGGNPNKWVISGQRRKNRETAAEGRELFEPLLLTNNRYLYLFYDNYTTDLDSLLPGS